MATSMLATVTPRPMRVPVVHELDQARDGVGRRRGQHAVAEVEDVTRPAAGPAQHVGGVPLDLVGRPEQHGGVEVALHGDAVAELAPGAVEVDAPVEADHVAAGGVRPAGACRRRRLAKWISGTPRPRTRVAHGLAGGGATKRS